MKGLAEVLRGLPDLFGRVIEMLEDHREAIRQMGDRLAKVDGGSRPTLGDIDLGDFGGRFTGLK